MDKAEFNRINQQLDSLDDRVRKVIARRKPLELDHSPVRARKNTPVNTPVNTPRRLARDPGYSSRPSVVASGQLTGRELPVYEPPECRQEQRGFDYTRDVIFADFNRAIDEMRNTGDD